MRNEEENCWNKNSYGCVTYSRQEISDLFDSNDISFEVAEIPNDLFNILVFLPSGAYSLNEHWPSKELAQNAVEHYRLGLKKEALLQTSGTKAKISYK